MDPPAESPDEERLVVRITVERVNEFSVRADGGAS
jgi:hypothetical protein